jgi:GntR family transcriptional regulator
MTSPQKTMPRYRQIKLALAALLRDGKWRHGQAIPSEPLLARRFDASIGTVRKAIDELVAENILVRQQGRGTFVKSHTRDTMLDTFFRLVDAEGRKELPRVELLSFDRGRADARTAAQLRIARSASTWRVRHLLLLDGLPTVFDDISLPAARFPGLSAAELSERDLTLYALLQQRFDVTVVRVVEHLDAVAAEGEVAQRLGVPEGHPLLHIRRTGYSHGGEPADTRERWVRTGERRYESVLGR